FKNLTIQNTSSAVARVFMIFNQSNYITIDSCEVVSDDQDDLFSFQVTNILMGPSTTSTFTEGDNGNHFKLLNSKIIGGEYGFVAEHQFNSLGTDIQLVNNQFISQLDGAVRIDNIDSLVFSNNE